MTQKNRGLFTGLLLASLSTLPFVQQAVAKVSLPPMYTNNMVLQQQSTVKIWGTSTFKHKAIEIKTSWDNKVYKTSSDGDGKWSAYLKTSTYGGPYSIIINDGDLEKLENVLLGEVWFCSGQSNMQMPLADWGKIENYESEIKAANYPNIRFLQTDMQTANLPQEQVPVLWGGWNAVSPQTIPAFSATAYFFARELNTKTGIPIGLIHSSWGGTIVEAWSSKESLAQFGTFSRSLARLSEPAAKADLDKEYALWNQIRDENDNGFVRGGLGWLDRNVDTKNWRTMQIPAFFDKEVFPGVDGIVYFRKKVHIPQNWVGKSLKLELGTIDDNDETYVNGIKVGETEGYATERHYQIPANANTDSILHIAVKVYDGAGEGGIYGDASLLKLIGPNNEEIKLAGDWFTNLGVDYRTLPPRPEAMEGPNRPTVLYNAMVNPFIDFKIKGVIWYQGESNTERTQAYRSLFPAMIKDWRNKWKQKDMPFYFVQLANFMAKDTEPTESAWAEIRDAQLYASTLPNTGIAVTTDIGDSADVHPKNKQEVGRRLALIALNKLYHSPTPYSGPQLKAWKVVGNHMELTLTPMAKKVVGTDNIAQGLKGFSIAGKDGKYVPALALLQGNKVVVSASAVPEPVSVRYAWANNPDLSLYNEAGLPASPFSTATWKKK